MIGTQASHQKTTQIEETLTGSRPTLLGTVRDTESFVVHPNVLKRPPAGRAIVVTKVPAFQWDVVQVCRAEPSE